MRILILSVITFFATMALDTLATETPKESVLDLLKKERELALQEHAAASAAIAASQAATASKVDAAVAAMDSVKNEAAKMQNQIKAIEKASDSIAIEAMYDSIRLQNALKLNGF
jgi:ATP-dependent DNA ligase